MSPTDAQKRASLKWDKENMITLGCKIRRDQAAAFKAYCGAQGKTSNTVLKEYVLSCIASDDGRDGATPGGNAPSHVESN